jgi:hypothetical protein
MQFLSAGLLQVTAVGKHFNKNIGLLFLLQLLPY